MPVDTKKLDRADTDVLRLPATGETKVLNRVKLRFVVGAGPERIEAAIVDEVMIGRTSPGSASKPDIDLASFVGPNNEQGVSRNHAIIRRVGQNLAIIDLDSTNGLWVNGVRLTPGEPMFLHDGDITFFGHLKLSIYFVA